MLNPLHTRNYKRPDTDYSEPLYFGVPPGSIWLYGNLDYTMNKTHRLYQSHDDWYPDRKAKSLGFKEGGLGDKRGTHSTEMLFIPIMNPRGCAREVKKFKDCAKEFGKGSDQCFEKKIGILEVCPNHKLHYMQESKKRRLRALAINNATYKRAMEISPYNQDRTLADVDPKKKWSDGMAKNLRPDSYFYDDRYVPEKYPHSHRYDAHNFPDQQYTDFFGGNMGEAERKAKEPHQIGFFKSLGTGVSEQMADFKTPTVDSKEDLEAKKYL